MLARASATQREAIVRWVRGGGRLVISPRGDGDLRDPLVRELGGDVTRVPRRDAALASVLVPAGEGRGLECGEGLVREVFGCTRALGFGAVHTLAYDANAEGVAGSSAVRELVRAVYADAFSPGVREPLLRFGVREDLATDYGGGAFGNGVPFGRLRGALDPNQSYVPGLGIAAVLLFLYVIVVGPVNFHFIGKRGKPVLALVTTPAAAAGCLLLLLGVGYLGKGVVMRYRRAEWLEVVEGDPHATARRYTAFFLTRPAVFDVGPPPGGALTVISAAAGDVPPTHLHGAGGTTLRELRGGLWETLAVREDRFVDLGGGITFERDGTRLAAVRNGGAVPLRGAFVVDGVGSVYEVGDLPPGATRPIPSTARFTIGAAVTYWGDAAQDPDVTRMAGLLGLRGEGEAKVFDALRQLAGGRFAVGMVPVLVARLPDADDTPADGLFARDLEVRLLRAVPRVAPVPVMPAPAAALGGPSGVTPPGEVPALPQADEEPPGAPETAAPETGAPAEGGRP
jgi:hypothetical protein